jgi:hypothetical protein
VVPEVKPRAGGRRPTLARRAPLGYRRVNRARQDLGVPRPSPPSGRWLFRSCASRPISLDAEVFVNSVSIVCPHLLGSHEPDEHPGRLPPRRRVLVGAGRALRRRVLCELALARSPGRVHRFWESVRAALGPAGRVFFLDESMDACRYEELFRETFADDPARSGPVRRIRADGLHLKHQPDTNRQASAGT